MNINEFKWLYMGREVHLLNFPNSAIPKHTRPYKPHGGGPPAGFDQIQAIEELDLRDTQRNLLFMKAIGEIKPVYNLTMNEAEAILEIGGTFMDPDPWAPVEAPITNKQRGTLHRIRDDKGAKFVSLRQTEVLGLGHDHVALGDLTRDQANKLIAKLAFYEEPESITTDQRANFEQFKTTKGPGFVNAGMQDAIGRVTAIGDLTREEATATLATIKDKISWNQVYNGPKNIR